VSTAGDELIRFWARFDKGSAPYIHPDDADWLLDAKRSGKVARLMSGNPQEWVDSVSPSAPSLVHLGLRPTPFVGDIRGADIFVCLLNPGLGASDFYAELHHPEYVDALIGSLRQVTYDGDGYPFVWLDPRFCWTGAGIWWTSKLKSVISEASIRWTCPYHVAAHRLSKRLAAVELFAYHSKDFTLGNGIKHLPSCRAAVSFIHEVSRDPSKTVIVTRQRAHWKLAEEGAQQVVYRDGRERGASLSADTEGGKAILDRLFDRKL
jgi:hypothetical protein